MYAAGLMAERLQRSRPNASAGIVIDGTRIRYVYSMIVKLIATILENPKTGQKTVFKTRTCVWFKAKGLRVAISILEEVVVSAQGFEPWTY